VKTLTFIVTIPNIPEGMKDEKVRSWLQGEISHPYDAAFEADVRVDWRSSYTPPANPEREGNGCMIHGEMKRD
jgi:hypothetical protein